MRFTGADAPGTDGPSTHVTSATLGHAAGSICTETNAIDPPSCKSRRLAEPTGPLSDCEGGR